MSNTIIIVGFGPGASSAVAEKFGAEGFSVALVARNEARLNAGVEALKAKGVPAGAFPADASDPSAIRSAIARARDEMGHIGVLHWNASSGHDVGDLLKVDPAEVTGPFDLAISGFLSAVQATIRDLSEPRQTARSLSPTALSGTAIRWSTPMLSPAEPKAWRSATPPKRSSPDFSRHG